jgi:hypothetical protein
LVAMYSQFLGILHTFEKSWSGMTQLAQTAIDAKESLLIHKVEMRLIGGAFAKASKPQESPTHDVLNCLLRSAVVIRRNLRWKKPVDLRPVGKLLADAMTIASVSADVRAGLAFDIMKITRIGNSEWLAKQQSSQG